jgi:hypothetical protein
MYELTRCSSRSFLFSHVLMKLGRLLEVRRAPNSSSSHNIEVITLIESISYAVVQEQRPAEPV